MTGFLWLEQVACWNGTGVTHPVAGVLAASDFDQLDYKQVKLLIMTTSGLFIVRMHVAGYLLTLSIWLVLGIAATSQPP